MDSTSANLTDIIAVNKLLYIRQIRCDPEGTSCYENVLTVVYGDTIPLRSSKQYPGVHDVSSLGTVQEFSGQASSMLDEEI